MIVDLFMELLLLILGGFIGLFPAYNLPESVTGFGTEMGSMMSTMNGLFPVVTMGVCLAAVMGMWLFLTVWQGIVFLYRLIPGKFT